MNVYMYVFVEFYFDHRVMTLFILFLQEIRQILFQKVPETRKALLLSEIDRVAQVCLLLLF